MFRSILQIYVKGSNEAFEFYKKAFDAKVGFQDIDENGIVIHRELMFMDRPLQLVRLMIPLEQVDIKG